MNDKTLFANVDKITYNELITFIEKANHDQLDTLAKDFNKIVFEKNFFIKLNEITQTRSILKSNPQNVTAQDLIKIKDDLSKNGVNGAYNDFTFFAGDAKWDEKTISQYMSETDFFGYVSWRDNSGNEFSKDDVLQQIKNISSQKELIEFLKNGPQEPVFKLPLTDEYLVKYDTLIDSEVSLFFDKTKSNSVNVNYGDVDKVFGTQKSLFENTWFSKKYAWKNVISPMLQMKLKNVPGILGNWRYDGDHIDEVVTDEKSNSVLYSRNMSFEEILDYDGSESMMFAETVPLNKERYFENKLKASQSSKYGVTMFSSPDGLKEAYTRDWYPSSFGTFQTMWQYFRTYIAWGNRFTLPSPAEVNVAHKNGVRVFGTLFNNESSSMLTRLMALSEEDQMVFVENIIKMIKARGVDGLFWNSEIATWKTSGMSLAAWVNYSKWLHYIDQRFTEEGLVLWQYTNHDVEVPMDGNEKKRDIIQQSGDNNVFSSSINSWRELNSIPGAATFSFNHFTPDFDFYDDKLGIGANDEIFNGFVDKAGDLQDSIYRRMKFVNEHPSYVLQVMTWEDAYQTRDWINREWDAIKQLKNNPSIKSTLPDSMWNEFYGDYAIYGDRHHVAYMDDLDFSIPLFSSRGGFKQVQPTYTGERYLTDFHETKFSAAEQRNKPHDVFNFQVSYWDRNGQDPRATTGAVSDYFQERSTVGSKDNFSTSFEVGYGHQLNIDGKKIFGDWQNLGAQDILPTYRYIIDKYDANGKLIDDSVNNYVGRKINAHLKETNDAYYGNDALTYDGTLAPKESLINKLYVANVDANKEFKVITRNSGLELSLALWRNGSLTPELVKPVSTKSLNNGYFEYTFNVKADSSTKITSFGLSFKNNDSKNVDLDKVLVDGISFSDSITAKPHTFSDFYAMSRNLETNGINIKFKDANWSESTRYYVYDSNGDLVTFSPTPYFYVKSAGKYKIVATDVFSSAKEEYELEINANKGYQYV